MPADFAKDPRFRARALSPGAQARQQLREEQDAAYYESLQVGGLLGSVGAGRGWVGEWVGRGLRATMNLTFSPPPRTPSHAPPWATLSEKEGGSCTWCSQCYSL